MSCTLYTMVNARMLHVRVLSLAWTSNMEWSLIHQFYLIWCGKFLYSTLNRPIQKGKWTWTRARHPPKGTLDDPRTSDVTTLVTTRLHEKRPCFTIWAVVPWKNCHCCKIGGGEISKKQFYDIKSNLHMKLNKMHHIPFQMFMTLKQETWWKNTLQFRKWIQSYSFVEKYTLFLEILQHIIKKLL